MNGSHVVATASLTAMIAGVLMWVSHWPLQPLDNSTAMDIAGLIVAFIGGGGIAVFNARANGHDDAPEPVPIITPAPVSAASAVPIPPAAPKP